MKHRLILLEKWTLGGYMPVGLFYWDGGLDALRIGFNHRLKVIESADFTRGIR